jgi:hypothetical protein
MPAMQPEALAKSVGGTGLDRNPSGRVSRGSRDHEHRCLRAISAGFTKRANHNSARRGTNPSTTKLVSDWYRAILVSDLSLKPMGLLPTAMMPRTEPPLAVVTSYDDWNASREFFCKQYAHVAIDASPGRFHRIATA